MAPFRAGGAFLGPADVAVLLEPGAGAVDGFAGGGPAVQLLELGGDQRLGRAAGGGVEGVLEQAARKTFAFNRPLLLDLAARVRAMDAVDADTLDWGAAG